MDAEQEFAEQKEALLSMCASLGANMMAFSNPSQRERELIETIDFLLRALMLVVERAK